MAIGRRATSVAFTSTLSTSFASALPAARQSGDVLILVVGRVHDYALTSATPSGWTFLRNIIDVATTPAAADCDIYWKVSDGSETAPTFTTGTGTRWVITCGAYSGVDATTPFLVENASTHTAASSTTHTGPTINNTDAAAWGVFACVWRGALTPCSTTVSGGVTGLIDQDIGFTNAVNGVGVWADTNATVATGNATYTATSSAAVPTAVMWAAFLNPAAAAAAQGPISPVSQYSSFH